MDVENFVSPIQVKSPPNTQHDNVWEYDVVEGDHLDSSSARAEDQNTKRHERRREQLGSENMKLMGTN